MLLALMLTPVTLAVLGLIAVERSRATVRR
jgi:hypothetical protein